MSGLSEQQVAAIKLRQSQIAKKLNGLHSEVVDTIMESVKATALVDEATGKTFTPEGPLDYGQLFLVQHMTIQFAAHLLKAVEEGLAEYLVKTGRARSFKTSGTEGLG